jgi:hypothetical protein
LNDNLLTETEGTGDFIVKTRRLFVFGIIYQNLASLIEEKLTLEKCIYTRLD